MSSRSFFLFVKIHRPLISMGISVAEESNGCPLLTLLR